jgi:low affinity Fe/Cu permease
MYETIILIILGFTVIWGAVELWIACGKTKGYDRDDELNY